MEEGFEWNGGPSTALVVTLLADKFAFMVCLTEAFRRRSPSRCNCDGIYTYDFLVSGIHTHTHHIFICTYMGTLLYFIY